MKTTHSGIAALHSRASICPDDEELVLYLDGALHAAAEARIRQHLGRCDVCRAVIVDVVRSESDDETRLADETRPAA